MSGFHTPTHLVSISKPRPPFDWLRYKGISLTNQGGFYPSVIETALDKLTMLVQQLNEQVGRAYRSSVVSSAIGTIAAYVTQAQNYATTALGHSNAAENFASASSGSATSAANASLSASGYANAAMIAAQTATAPSVSVLIPALDAFMNGPDHVTFAAMYIAGGWDMGGITGSSPFSNENQASRRASLSSGSISLDFGTLP